MPLHDLARHRVDDADGDLGRNPELRAVRGPFGSARAAVDQDVGDDLPLSCIITCAMFVVSEVLTRYFPSGLMPISGSTPTGSAQAPRQETVGGADGRRRRASHPVLARVGARPYRWRWDRSRGSQQTPRWREVDSNPRSPVEDSTFSRHPGNRRLRNRPDSQNRVLTITRAGFTVRRAGLASNAGRPPFPRP